ncbi:MAG: hypothetical protein Q9204_000695 [Flavoplaca sp. TL-2023a]
MSEDSDDTLQICVGFVRERLKHHDESNQGVPFFLGVNGVQGIGKSYLAASLAHELEQAASKLRTVVLSIDDFYLNHENQTQLAADHPDNPLVQHRGQPSTHEIPLALSVLTSLRAEQETSIPSYDKSAFDGRGNRKPQNQWTTVNKAGQQPIKIVVLEGWCVGFRALDDINLTTLWLSAVELSTRGCGYQGRLGHSRLQDVKFINEALKGYDSLTDQLDALIHLDAEDLQHVYAWRLEQEDQLHQERGSGMTKAEVVKFIDGYYPSYELYTDRLRSGVFGNRVGAQLRLVIRKDRLVQDVIKI